MTVAICPEKRGLEHVDAATNFNNLSSVYHSFGDLQRARECKNGAMASRLKKLGLDHVDVATTYNDLGLVYRDLGDLQEAAEPS